MVAPTAIVERRPKASAIYGVIRPDTVAPTVCIDPSNPSRAPLGWSNADGQTTSDTLFWSHHSATAVSSADRSLSIHRILDSLKIAGLRPAKSRESGDPYGESNPKPCRQHNCMVKPDRGPFVEHQKIHFDVILGRDWLMETSCRYSGDPRITKLQGISRNMSGRFRPELT